MDRDDFIRFADEALHTFQPPPERAYDYSVVTTSGTTGAALLLRVIGHRRRNRSAYFQEWANGGERIVIAYGSLGTRLLQLLALRTHASSASARGIALDYEDLTPALSALMDDLKPDRFVGSPSFMVRLGERLSGPVRGGVESMRYAGERISAAQRELLQAAYPNAALDTTYTSIETGVLSQSSCGHLPPNQYHVQKWAHVAIEEPDETGAGNIVVSIPDDEIVLIQDYRIGDVGRLVQKTCPCGERQVLEVLGRKGRDYIKLAGAILLDDEFERVVRLIGAFDDYRVEVSDCVDGGAYKGRIRILAYRRTPAGTAALQREVQEQFSRALYLTPTQTLAHLVEQNLFMPLEITYTDAPFPQDAKEVKLRQNLQ